MTTQKEETPKEDSSTKSQLSEYFNSLKEYLPLFTIYILFISLERNQAYYKYYNVEIINFITFSELIPPIINNIVSFLILTIYFTCYIFFANSLEKREKQLVLIRKSKQGYVYFKWKFFDFIARFGLLISVLSFPMVIFLVLIISTSSIINYNILAYAIAPVCFSMMIGSYFIKKFKFNIQWNHLVLFSSMIGFGFASIGDGRVIALNFYTDREKHNSFILFEEDTSNYCSYNKWLIGLTDQYAIFWDEKLVQPEVRKRSDIKIIRPGLLPITSLQSVADIHKKIIY